MPRRLVVASHPGPDQLRARACAAPADDRVRWLAVRLVAEGRPATEVGPLVGFSPEWVRTLVRRYNADGPAALADQRRGNAGGLLLLDPAQQEELRAALGGPGARRGDLDCRSVAAWMGERLGRPVSEQRGSAWLRRLEFTPQRPRPREERADPAAQAALQKRGLQAAIDAVAARPPRAAVEAVGGDEHRLGCCRSCAGLGAARAQRPIAHGRSGSTPGCTSTASCVRSTGQTLVVPAADVSVDGDDPGPGRLARDEGVDADHRAVLVVDQAGWHTSPRLVLPVGVDLAFLPPYSPELQPAERLWGPGRRGGRQPHLADLGQLQDALADRCRALERHRPALKARCHYHWWPHERRKHKPE